LNVVSHSHAHQHIDHSVKLGKAFTAGIVLNLVFVVIEAIAGLNSGSLALLSDAGHNLSDVASMALSLFAFRISSRKPEPRFTYGFSKSTILVSLANAIVLVLAVGIIGWEAVHRFFKPELPEGKTVTIVAAIGILVNGLSALFFYRQDRSELNVRGAYLHLAADAAVSLGVVMAGVLMMYTGLSWIDPVVSIVIMIVILYGTWSLLKESLRLSMDAVPESIDPAEIRTVIMRTPGVVKVFHIHIWAMSTTKNALTAHVIIEHQKTHDEIHNIKEQIRHGLGHLNVQHVTLETEVRSRE
jgi:cobalt-zinc-cadmium efflux system protein